MLVPAILHKDFIEQEFKKFYYTDDMMFETGYLDNFVPDIAENPDACTMQYAIINKEGKCIGYLAYTIDWYSSSAYNFGLFSFDRGNVIIGRDLFNEMEKLIHEYKLHRIEWKVISGNPVKRSYDKFCEKYHGRVLEMRDVFKDRHGNYRNSYTYEIINDEENNNGK